MRQGTGRAVSAAAGRLEGVLRFVAVLCCALVAGLTLSHVLQAPGSRGLDAPAWLAVQQTFYGGFAVVGGLAEVVGVLAAAGEVVLRRRRGAPFLAPAVAAACLLGTLVSFAVGNRPVNAQVATWTATTIPADWAELRDRWEAAHALSAALSLLALVVLVAATVGSTRVADAAASGRRRGAGRR